MPSTRIVALTLTAAALAASGCGGSKPSSNAASTQTSTQAHTAASGSTASDSSTPSLTRGALIKKADAICAPVNAKRSAITVSTPKDYATKLPALAAVEQAADAALSKLVPPAAMAGDWAQIVSASQTVASDTAKIAAGTTAKDTHAMQAAWSSANQAQHRLSALAMRDGFKVCGHISR